MKLDCSTVPRHRVSVRSEPDPKRFRVTKEAPVRQFSTAALDAWTDAELDEKAARAFFKMAYLVPEVATTNLLWCTPDEMPLY